MITCNLLACGGVQGYALVEYANKDEADAAIEALDGKKLLGQDIHVDYAFVKGASAVRAVCDLSRVLTVITCFARCCR